LQGLFTPAALAAALQAVTRAPAAVAPPAANPAVSCGMLASTAPSAPAGLPPQFNCGAPAWESACSTGLPREFNCEAPDSSPSRPTGLPGRGSQPVDRPSTIPPATATDARPASGFPLPRTGDGLGVAATSPRRK
jgi:hypothetical protein